jgi:ribokinase
VLIFTVERAEARRCETAAVKVAVVGHVEWVEFARVEHVPAAGDIVHAVERWEEPGGGGAVAAVELARLAGEASLFTALSRDALGVEARAQLEARNVRVHTPVVTDSQRRAFVHLDGAGERTITVLGTKLRPRVKDDLPWHELEEADAVFFVSGDAGALRAARRARMLVATARELPTLRDGAVELDALVGSGKDDGERYRAGEIDPPPRVVVATSGSLGGWAQPGGPYRAVAIPGPIEDAYGCGDCFAAGLAYALGDGLAFEEALAFGAERGAVALTRRGGIGAVGE